MVTTVMAFANPELSLVGSKIMVSIGKFSTKEGNSMSLLQHRANPTSRGITLNDEVLRKVR